METAWLYLPASEQQIARTLGRIEIISQDAAYFIEDSTLPPKVFAVIERPDDAILELNRLDYQGLRQAPQAAPHRLLSPKARNEQPVLSGSPALPTCNSSSHVL